VEGVHIIPCFSNATSDLGSISVNNCSCTNKELVRMERKPQWSSEDIIKAIIQFGLSSSDFFYCLSLPPNAIYNETTKKISCKNGWTEVWSKSGFVDLLQGCVLCPLGQYAIRDPSLQSISYRLSDTNDAICKICPKGTYSASRDMIGNCTPCPLTQTTLREGSTRLEDCECPPSMTKRSSDGVCIGCNSNQYVSPTTKLCIDCPPFSMITSPLVTECTCSPGYTLPPSSQRKVSAIGCIPCPKNTYSAFSSNMPCKSCPKGSLTIDVGAKSIRECGASASLCLPGYIWKSNFGCISRSSLV
jgi:hypothetical protein